jgi:hypothetical protein
MKRIVEVLFLAVLCLRAGPADAGQLPRADSGLTVLSTAPTGEVASLAEVNEIRVVFSEPMVTLGRIPSDVRPTAEFSNRPEIPLDAQYSNESCPSSTGISAHCNRTRS